MATQKYLVVTCDAEDESKPDGICGAEDRWTMLALTDPIIRRKLRDMGWRYMPAGTKGMAKLTREICPKCWEAGRR